MSDAQEFRASTDQMLQMLDRLKDLEQQKQRVAFGSADFLSIAGEAEQLARVVFRWGIMQHQMAKLLRRPSSAGNNHARHSPR